MQTRAINCPTDAYDYIKQVLSFNALRAFDQMVIKFTYNKPSGNTWFDLVSLLK
jgi:hypothetical protein